MTGMLELRELGIDPGTIEQIELHLPDMHAGILPFAHPRDRSEALFSLPFCAAMALLTGNLTSADIAAGAWRRDDVRALIDRTVVKPFKVARPELNYDPEQPDRVVLGCRDGCHSVDIAYPLGSPQRPISAAQLRKKFQLNAGLDEAACEQLWERLMGWQQAEDIHRLFVASPAALPG
jgi:2-methylcitrate dehydratase